MQEIYLYRLRLSTRVAEVGHYPQIEGLKDRTRNDVAAYDALLKVDAIPERLPRTNSLLVHPDAKMTSALSSSLVPESIGLCVNDNLRVLLHEYALANVHYSEVTFANRKTTTSYFLLYVAASPELVDFEKSVYVETDILGRAEGPDRTFASHRDLLSSARELVATSGRAIIPKSIALVDVPDLFRLPYDFGGIHVSGRLKDGLQAAEVSGITSQKSTVEFWR